MLVLLKIFVFLFTLFTSISFFTLFPNLVFFSVFISQLIVRSIAIMASYASASEVSTLVENVNTASKAFSAVSGREVEDARRKLQVEAVKLLYSLQEPNTEVWPRIFQVS